MKDINIFNDAIKEKIYRQALVNYLKADSNNARIDECRNCETLFVIKASDIGVYRCHDNKCRYLSCCVCGKSVMANNKVDFEQHAEKCWPKRKHDFFYELTLAARRFRYIRQNKKGERWDR